MKQILNKVKKWTKGEKNWIENIFAKVWKFAFSEAVLHTAHLDKEKKRGNGENEVEK